MKKLLLSATACLTMAVSSNAQEIKPCGTYQAREIYLKTVPGYAAKLNAAEAQTALEYQTYLQNLNSAAKTSSLSSSYTFTVPVVFHVLHLGEPVGTGINISDASLINALAQVNRDYARKGADTVNIDPLFEPLYKDAHMHFELAKKDPQGNCTTGIVRHYDPKTNWSQADLFNYQYSTMAAGNWNPSKYLNIYIVKNIIDDGGSAGIVVGYTHLPGTAPIDPADAIVYRYDFLGGLNARSLSHEIGHWFGLSHTFGSSNNAGVECGADDIGDTPNTTGFFSTCPKLSMNYQIPSAVINPTDSSDIISVGFGSMKSITALNSLNGTFIREATTSAGTVNVATTKTISIASSGGSNGSYSDFTDETYPNDLFSSTSKTISIQSLAKSTDNNYVGVYIDYNRNGSFADAGEAVYIPTVTVSNYNIVPLSTLNGPQTYTWSNTPMKINKTYTVVTGTPPSTVVSTFTTTPDSFALVPQVITIPSGANGLLKMRVITSSTPITSSTMIVNSGEFEDYLLNVNLISCDSIRPNIENIMDYSSCPKMFTAGQITKMRQSAQSMVSFRQMLVDTVNLKFTGLLDANGNPTTTSPCAPIADFASNKFINCAGQSFTFNNTSYNYSSPITSYSWVFEGGSPATSTLATQTVTYSTPGTYSVSLTVTNADGTSTKNRLSYVTTNWNAGPTTLPYSENFESGQWWPQGMAIKNADLGTPGWELSNNYGAGVTASSMKSIVLPNASSPGFQNNAANVDIFELPPFDFTNTTNISISFDYSFARKTGVVADTFKLQYSLDCGGSWKNVPGMPSANTMAASGGTVNAPYIPWSALTTSIVPNPKWITKTLSVSLTQLYNQRDVKFRFWFQNDIATGNSQNLYIDNINVSGTVGLNEFENSLGLSIYPNPTNSTSNVEFISPYDSKVNISVFDIAGRVVEEGSVNAVSGTASKYTVNASNKLNAGIYFISINIEGRKVIKKLIIQ